MDTRSARALLSRARTRMVARLLALMAGVGLSAGAAAIDITVTTPDGVAINGGFRYTIEEDATLDVIPDVTGLSGNPVTDPTLALAFHTSHTKVVKVGRAGTATVSWDPPGGSNKRYFVSVLPDNADFGANVPTGYTMGGVPIRPLLNPDGKTYSPNYPGTVSVPVNKLPFKTAQISVFVFEDNSPTNGAPDAPGEQESALCGWEVQLFEAGGTYGASGGRVATDTFGNPLGTVYQFDINNQPVYVDGAPAVKELGANQLWTDRNGVLRIKNLSPAKYTLYSIAPPVMPSVQRCNFANADGSPSNIPIWIPNEAARTRPDQLAWDNGFEIAPSIHGQDQSKWHQTTTIEGTWGVDAWVKSGEPTFFKEFGPPGHHVWHGFVRRFKDTAALNGGASVTGKVVSTHMSRPPGIRFYSGKPMDACWIGITEVATGVGLGRTVYANSCSDVPGEEGKFTVTGLRPGARYQLNVWDEPLDNVIANYEFSVPLAGGTVDLKDVPVFSWFSNLQGKVFYDREGNGFPIYTGSGPDQGKAKPGIPQSIVNIRFRDGSIYNSTITDDEGKYEFAEVFPFFNWMVAETDFTRFKATGATIVPDDGGLVANAPAALRGTLPDGSTEGLWPDGTLTPQVQPDTSLPYRIFGGVDSSNQPVAPSSANLLQAFQGFLGQTNIIHWGKKDYTPGDPYDHGGITGVVHYASTRAEFDPKFATAENNEPGVPSVEIRLYKLNAQNKVVAPDGSIVEPKDANETHAVQVVVSDNWNKAQPENCVDPLPYKDRAGHDFTTGTNQSKCYDGMRIWNQVRDGVFDGGWAFVDRCPDGTKVSVVRVDGEYDSTECVPLAGGTAVPAVALEPGRYMTEGVAPYGYEHQKEEDKNVDFGDLLSPGTLANPAECLGSRDEALDGEGNPYTADPVNAPFLVPQFLTQYEGVEIPDRFRDVSLGGGQYLRRPYCNKKLVVVAPGMNPYSDFHMFAKAPVAGHIVGMILDDLANEFDPYAPSFGEKYAPPFMPVSIRDYAGNEINRVYSDRYGTYNAMVPSTFAYNVPLPSGVAPNMVNVCLNSPTMQVPDPNDATKRITVLDPHYNPQYTQFCYTFQYLPGKTTYLDTPVLPIAAFAGPSQYALDTAQPDGTPGIKMVTRYDGTNDVGGPWIPATGSRTVRIHAMGMTRVDNPAYDRTAFDTAVGTDPDPTKVPKTIERNFGFGGTAGQVLIGGAPVPAANVSWGDATIVVNVPAGLHGTVEVVAANGRRSARGVTLHSGTTNMPSAGPILVGASRSFKTIQKAIDDPNTRDGDLILVDPGLYEEAPILWKRVRVQGAGAPATIVNASMGADYLRQQTWRELACKLVLNEGMSAALLPGQTVPATMEACLTGDTADNAPLLFASEESSGFFVLQKPLAGGNGRAANGPFVTGTGAAAPVEALQIDGFTVSGADTGGGIVANGNAIQLQISNNIVIGNQGLYNGGIRIGHADLAAVNDLPVDANNLLVDIHHNEILKNGNTAGEVSGGGGGVSIYTGALGYRVAQNYIAGNFSTGDGGGMAHVGASGSLVLNDVRPTVLANVLVAADNRSDVARGNGNRNVTYASSVSDNQFRFNQSFNQAKSVQGGGLAIVGIVDPVAGNGVALGTGSVTVLNNTFQGNLAGAGDGGGIALVGVNGSGDVVAGSVGLPVGGVRQINWNRVDILNNVIVNNGAGVAGGGISLQDAANVNIVNNTIAMNDSYATAARAFQGGNSPTNASNCAQGLGSLGCSMIAQSVVQDGAGITAYGHSAGLLNHMLTSLSAAEQLGALKARLISDALVVNSVVLGNRSFNWRIDYSISQTACSYNTANGTPCFGLIGPAAQSRSGNDVAVLFPPPLAALLGADRMSSAYSVFTSLHAADGTTGNNNKTGDVTIPGIDFTSAFLLGGNGALKQLVYALEQSVVIGAPVLEVQEPVVTTVPSTAAAFDEGGNFIDLRFGPLTRGGLTGSAPQTWTDFGTYNPTGTAAAAAGDFGSGLSSVTTSVSPKLATDRNGVSRSSTNFVRGALAQ